MVAQRRRRRYAVRYTNVAVLVEAAVRNAILQLRGINTYQEFVERHRNAMEQED